MRPPSVKEWVGKSWDTRELMPSPGRFGLLWSPLFLFYQEHAAPRAAAGLMLVLTDGSFSQPGGLRSREAGQIPPSGSSVLVLVQHEQVKKEWGPDIGECWSRMLE